MTKKNRSAGELGGFLEINCPQGIALYLSGNGDRLQRLQESKGEAAAPIHVSIHALFLYSPLIIGIWLDFISNYFRISKVCVSLDDKRDSIP
jgi:hypothetical protein